MALQNYGVETIKSFYHKGKYYIPNYQRDYSWEAQNEVNELWQDILMLHRDNIDEYFLGQTVIHVENKQKRIIDGQQRTITLFLLFLAMRIELEKIFYNQTAPCSPSTKNDIMKIIQKINPMLGIVDENDDEDVVHLGKNDKDFFRKLIYLNDQTIKSKPVRNSQKKLIQTYNYFTKKNN